MSVDKKRRDVLGILFGGVATVGGVLSLGAMKSSWDPLPSVLSAGFLTVDLSPLKEGELTTVQWRGKPIFIMKKAQGSKPNPKRCISIGNDEYAIMEGICTHLGCIPAWKEKDQRYKCACHGGEFDIDGVNTFGPPPTPMKTPPFKLDGTKITLGEEGPEYKKLVGKA